MNNKKTKTMTTMTLREHPERVIPEICETLVTFLTIENNNHNIHLMSLQLRVTGGSIHNSCNVLGVFVGISYFGVQNYGSTNFASVKEMTNIMVSDSWLCAEKS